MPSRINEPKAVFYKSESGAQCVIHARLSRGVKGYLVNSIDLWLIDHKPHVYDAVDVVFAEMIFNTTTHKWEDYNVQFIADTRSPN